MFLDTMDLPFIKIEYSYGDIIKYFGGSNVLKYEETDLVICHHGACVSLLHYHRALSTFD